MFYLSVESSDDGKDQACLPCNATPATIPFPLQIVLIMICSLIDWLVVTSYKNVFLLTKIRPEYLDILYNPTHFPGPLVCRIRQVPPYIIQYFSYIVAVSFIYDHDYDGPVLIMND
jgi:hypothetical protein